MRCKECKYYLSDVIETANGTKVNVQPYCHFIRDGVHGAPCDVDTDDNKKTAFWYAINGVTYCSNCHETAKLETYEPDDEAPFGSYAKTKYCPNCGRKMDNPKEGERNAKIH